MTAPGGHEPLPELLERARAADLALIGLGIPRCPACDLLPASLTAVADARPGLVAGVALFATPEDWELRETLLWPLGIRVSRASVPALVVLRRGEVVATRQGGAPAHALDVWLTEIAGPAATPVPPGPTPGERAVLEGTAARRVQHLSVRSRHEV